MKYLITRENGQPKCLSATRKNGNQTLQTKYEGEVLSFRLYDIDAPNATKVRIKYDGKIKAFGTVAEMIFGRIQSTTGLYQFRNYVFTGNNYEVHTSTIGVYESSFFYSQANGVYVAKACEYGWKGQTFGTQQEYQIWSYDGINWYQQVCQTGDNYEQRMQQLRGYYFEYNGDIYLINQYRRLFKLDLEQNVWIHLGERIFDVGTSGYKFEAQNDEQFYYSKEGYMSMTYYLQSYESIVWNTGWIETVGYLDKTWFKTGISFPSGSGNFIKTLNKDIYLFQTVEDSKDVYKIFFNGAFYEVFRNIYDSTDRFFGIWYSPTDQKLHLLNDKQYAGSHYRTTLQHSSITLEDLINGNPWQLIMELTFEDTSYGSISLSLSDTTL